MSLRKKIIAGNWKMNKTSKEAQELIKAISSGFNPEASANVEIVVCPPFTSLEAAGEILSSSPIHLGAQNLHEKSSGAFTGEISAPMLCQIGVSYVIIGHSERRQYFSESNVLLREKVAQALSSNLIPIFCIGETLEKRESGEWKTLLEEQISEGLQGISPEELSGIVIAYEPVWAIGTGKIATPEQVQETHEHIRSVLTKISSSDAAEKICIQYGGSVKAENAGEILSCKDVDGVLVGGASLDALSFLKIATS